MTKKDIKEEGRRCKGIFSLFLKKLFLKNLIF